MEKQSLVEINSKDSALEACRLMNAHAISALPVYDSTKQKYIGFLSNLDIIKYVVSLILEDNLSPVEIAALDCITKKLEVIPCGSMPFLQPFNPLVIENSGGDLLFNELFSKIIANMKNGDSRVPIVDKDGRIIRLISQSNIMKYLAQHLDELDSRLISTSLSDLKLLHHSNDEKNPKIVIGVHTCNSVLEGIDKMASHNLSSVAVFTDDGELLTNISASDIITGIVKHMNFNKSIQSFISEIRTKHSRLFKRDGKDFPAAVVASPASSLKNVISKLAATGLHRIFVCDSSLNKCVGIVSLQDILNIIIV